MITREQQERSLERSRWFKENAERLYHGALLMCGPPPDKECFTRNLDIVETQRYRDWLRLSWHMLWTQVPDKYKINHHYYYSGYGRSEQAEVLRDGYLEWLEKNSGL